MTTQDAISKRIYELCEERNIALGKLCTMAGTTPSTISDIVNGVTKNPGIITIKKLCDGIDITLPQFFDTDYFRALQIEKII